MVKIMKYQMLNRDDIRQIFCSVLEDKGLEAEEKKLDNLFNEFLEIPCNFDYSKPLNAEVERQARIFLDRRSLS
jgi:uncharacterized protein YpuA (DUF1002 family)